ncbi:ABC transporter ATP-binding protein [Bordetella pertussis]|uniref:ATP-binding component of ABC transporter protein n=1 Tax=Bordetella pertussis (strain ATCC 9797 / DSM 5571 / CCUG 30873 / LMG 14455 / NCTC 10739 / 18323) TaxID=568706 RepID=A0A0T7CQ18_BORP1|nr:ABC transporter ATP-binding protein [Bordetella pertussis]AZR85225.1 ABC transporter ATP-binding protein [Bordetella pertussis]PNO98072.1 ABC transporter ATP-binding protein [Bordetella pertussis 18323]UEB58431.1 ABC transporter ATP-binding protein [Bordetella pertussis]CCJ63631.1 ATP-binding component of ABC transporter protein [Bordetella pertussis 18323]CFP52877.1 ABC transporter ATP-binding protein [Bordetella pertussis]
MLKIQDLHAWYGSSHILQGVSLDVERGELVCLVGRNGAGKTTTVKSVAGLIPKARGTIRFDGRDILGLPAHARYAMGLAYVPEERRIVPGLTVRENIQLGLLRSPLHRREKEVIDEIAETFPRLKERLDQQAVTMSGGEQQILAIARAAASKPKFIMLDEPSEGIMPVLVDEMFRYFETLKAAGVTMLLIEQNVELALAIADRAYILDQGEVVYSGGAQAMLADEVMQGRYCSV